LSFDSFKKRSYACDRNKIDNKKFAVMSYMGLIFTTFILEILIKKQLSLVVLRLKF